MNDGEFLGRPRKILDHVLPTEAEDQAEHDGFFKDGADKREKRRVAHQSQRQHPHIPEKNPIKGKMAQFTQVQYQKRKHDPQRDHEYDQRGVGGVFAHDNG